MNQDKEKNSIVLVLSHFLQYKFVDITSKVRKPIISKLVAHLERLLKVGRTLYLLIGLDDNGLSLNMISSINFQKTQKTNNDPEEYLKCHPINDTSS